MKAYTRKNNSQRYSIKPTLHIQSPDTSLPFWKVRDTSIPRISKEPVSAETKQAIRESIQKYQQYMQSNSIVHKQAKAKSKVKSTTKSKVKAEAKAS